MRVGGKQSTAYPDFVGSGNQIELKFHV